MPFASLRTVLRAGAPLVVALVGACVLSLPAADSRVYRCETDDDCLARYACRDHVCTSLFEADVDDLGDSGGDAGGDSALCVPDCTDRECGKDDICQESCGVCPSSGDSCEAGRCVPCTPGLGCDDGDDCTYGDICTINGECVSTRIVCESDTPPCGVKRTCNGTPDCVVSMPNVETDCTDEKACTANDHCDGQGGCKGESYDCLPEAGTCGRVPTCDGSGGCTYAVPPSYTTCDDGNLCTQYDHCDGIRSGDAACTSETLTGCTESSDPCAPHGRCVGDGSCIYDQFPGSETPCNDLSACTTNDRCNGAGQCVGTRGTSVHRCYSASRDVYYYSLGDIAGCDPTGCGGFADQGVVWRVPPGTGGISFFSLIQSWGTAPDATCLWCGDFMPSLGTNEAPNCYAPGYYNGSIWVTGGNLGTNYATVALPGQVKLTRWSSTTVYRHFVQTGTDAKPTWANTVDAIMGYACPP